MTEIPFKHRYPWRPGNRFELLVDGQAYFPRMLEAIELARSRVWLEIYLFESGAVAERFIGALERAARRGVEVRVLADAWGAARLDAADRTRLIDAGVQVVLYNPLHWRKWFGNLFRDHRKLLIVDGRAAFVSGTGITDDFDNPRHPERSWHDIALRISGPVLADWQTLFARLWRRYFDSSVSDSPEIPAAVIDGLPGRVAYSASLRAQDIRRSLYKRVRGAERCAWMATAYFVPSRKLLRALKRAARRGVDVRLLLPGPHSDHPAVRHAGRRFYSGLLRAGVRVFEYQPRFLHAKSVVCDDWVSAGSSNFDRWNLRWNLEANQEIDDSKFAAEIKAMLAKDMLVSEEILLETWRRRGMRARLRERLWGGVDRLLESLGRRRGIRMK